MANENIRKLFNRKAKRLIKDKYITSKSLIHDNKTIHVIYIADDKEIYDYYLKQKEIKWKQLKL